MPDSYHELAVGWDTYCGCNGLSSVQGKPVSLDDSLKRAFHVSRKIVININLQGNVNITRIIQLESASWLFIFGVSLLWIFKGPRISSEHYDLGLFFPIGIHTYPSWMTVLHVYVILALASILSLMSWTSLLMRKTCKWKLVTLRWFVSTALFIFLVEILCINPVCSTVAPITIQTIKEAIQNSLGNYKEHLGSLQKYWTGDVATAYPVGTGTEIPSRNLLPNSYQGVMHWLINAFGGCEHIHSALWSLTLLSFSYSWLLLSLAAMPFSVLNDVASVYDLLYWIRPSKLEPAIQLVNELTYKVSNRFESAKITLKSISSGLPNGEGMIQFSEPNAYNLMTGTWNQGVFCSPFIYRNDKLGIIRSFAHIHLELRRNGDCAAYHASLTVVSSRLISDTGDLIWPTKHMIAEHTDLLSALRTYRRLWKNRNVLLLSMVGECMLPRRNRKTAAGAAGGIANKAGVYLQEMADSELDYMPFVMSVSYTGNLFDRCAWKYWRCDEQWDAHGETMKSVYNMLMSTSRGVSIISHGMSIVPMAKTLIEFQKSVNLTDRPRCIPRLFAMAGISDVLGSAYFPSNEGGLLHLRLIVGQIVVDRRPVIFAGAEDTSIWRKLMIRQMFEDVEESGPLMMVRMEAYGSDHLIEFTLRQLSKTLRKVPITFVKMLSSFYVSSRSHPLGLNATDLRQLSAYLIEPPETVLRQKILPNTYLY